MRSIIPLTSPVRLPWAARSFPAACSLLAACTLLAACGHRGALYMPGTPGDPAYDREHKGETPFVPGSIPSFSPAPAKSSTTPAPSTAPAAPTKPATEDKAVGSDKVGS